MSDIGAEDGDVPFMEDSSGEEDSNGFNIEFMDIVAYSLGYQNRELDYVWGSLVISFSLILIATSLFLNWFVFTFYMKKVSEDIVSTIYTLLSGFDMTVSLGGLASVISLMLYLSLDMENEPREKVYPSVKVFCISSFLISSIANRLSICINALLSLVRTVMIKNPFARVSRKGVCTFLGLVLLFWTFLTCGDVYVLKVLNIDHHWTKALERKSLDKAILDTPKQNLYLWYYVFNSMAGYYHLAEIIGDRIPWGMGLIEIPSEASQIAEKIIPYLVFVLAYLIATVVSLVCLVIQTVHLRNSEFSNENTKQVTITIVILTAVFVICNIASIIYIGIEVAVFEHQYNAYGEQLAVRDETTIQQFYRGMFIFQQMIPLLNSTLNPMILILRGSKLKQYMEQSIGISKAPQNSIHLRNTIVNKETNTTC